MKTLIKIFNCICLKIKKNFFIKEKTDIYQECDEVFETTENKAGNRLEKEIEEYMMNYKNTTRWQTV